MQAELVRSLPDVDTDVLSVVVQAEPKTLADVFEITEREAYAIQHYILGTLVLRYRCMVAFQPVGHLPTLLSLNYSNIPHQYRAKVRAWLRED